MSRGIDPRLTREEVVRTLARVLTVWEPADQFAAALAQYPALQEPVWLAGDRQYFCNYDVEGVEIGASTVEVDSDHDTTETFGTGPWRHFVEVPLGAHRVPAVRLELRLATEMLRRRRDRAAHCLSTRPRLRHAPRRPCAGERRHRSAHPQRRARQALAGPIAPETAETAESRRIG